MRKPTAADFVARLQSNSNDYHFRRIDHVTFSERQRETWVAIEVSPRMKSRVLSMLRTFGMAVQS